MTIKMYNFSVRDFDAKYAFPVEMESDKTFGSFLMELENFKNFVNRFPGKEIALHIQKKEFLYSQIEKKKIHDLFVEKGLAKNLRPKEVIEISFSNRELGGK